MLLVASEPNEKFKAYVNTKSRMSKVVHQACLQIPNDVMDYRLHRPENQQVRVISLNLPLKSGNFPTMFT